MQMGPFRGQDASGWRMARPTRLHAKRVTWGFFATKYLHKTKSAFVFFWGLGKQTSDYAPGTWRRTDVHLENPEYHTRWFFKYFLGKGQCVHVRRRGLNAACGSLWGEHPLAVGMKVSYMHGLPSLVHWTYLIWPRRPHRLSFSTM